MKNISIYIIITLLGLQLSAQDISSEVLSEIDQIAKVYQEANSLSQQIEVKLYDNWNGGKVVEEERGKVQKQGDLLHLKFAHVEYLASEEHLLTVDHQNKFAMLAKRPAQLPSAEFEIDLQASLKGCSSAEVSKKGGTGFLTMVYTESQYEKMVVSYNASTKLVSKVTLYFAQPTQVEEDGEPVKPRMEISYNQVSVNEPLPKANFSLAKFVTNLKSEQRSMAPSFKAYRLVSSI
jgi:hypothetical protein